MPDAEISPCLRRAADLVVDDNGYAYVSILYLMNGPPEESICYTFHRGLRARSFGTSTKTATYDTPQFRETLAYVFRSDQVWRDLRLRTLSFQTRMCAM